MSRFILSSVLGPACSHALISDDEVIPVTSSGLGYVSEDEICDDEACEDGILLLDPLNDTQAICLEFLESQRDAKLTSSFSHMGLAVADYDQDGKDDVLLLNANGSNQMFRNLGGTFSESMELENFFARAAAFSDFDSDGDLDLAITGEDGSAVYKNNGANFSELTSSGISDGSFGASVVWIESGFLFATENGTQFYEYEGGSSFSEITQEAGLDDYGSGSVIVVADYDGDRRDDVFVANATGQNRLFRNLGGGVFESVEESLHVVGSGNAVSTGAAWVKLKGESKPSLYVANWDGGNEFYTRENDGSFTNSASDLGLRDAGNTTNVATATLHPDLDPVFFLGRSDQKNLFYVPVYDKNGNLSFYEDAAEGLNLNDVGVSMGSAWIDYDGDADLDLLTVMYEGTLKLYQNQTHEVELCEK